MKYLVVSLFLLLGACTTVSASGPILGKAQGSMLKTKIHENEVLIVYVKPEVEYGPGKKIAIQVSHVTAAHLVGNNCVSREQVAIPQHTIGHVKHYKKAVGRCPGKVKTGIPTPVKVAGITVGVIVMIPIIIVVGAFALFGMFMGG